MIPAIDATFSTKPRLRASIGGSRSRVSATRAVTTSLAPADARRRAIDAPMPDDAPVTRARASWNGDVGRWDAATRELRARAYQPRRAPPLAASRSCGDDGRRALRGPYAAL